MASALIDKLNDALRDRLPDFQSGLTHGSSNDRVTGYIVSSAFVDLDHADRQARLRELLVEIATPEEMMRIGPIVTMNPFEADVTSEAVNPKKRAG